TAEKHSEHHLAAAVVDAAREPADSVATDGGLVAEEPASAKAIPDPDDFEVVPGRGVVAHHDSQEIVVGNETLLGESGIEIQETAREYVREREEVGETPVYVALDGTVVGSISLRDELREAAPAVVAALQDDGVETVMLTGDNERTARAVAREVGIDVYRAELLPEDKQTAIEELREQHTVAMVGDGINDAPSLATADVGIAMGTAGTDTAIETADVALMADDLERIPSVIGLSKATRRNVRQNVGLAVLTVGLLLAGVLGSVVHLAGGMLVHEGSVLLVIGNGMRLLRY
ncbi:MAG: heavy metal translocating P-type ATPase, partial [Halapricum sp.]